MQTFRVGAKETIRDEYAEECADQCTTDHVPEHLWGFADRTHRLDDTQHGSNDTESRRSVSKRRQPKQESGFSGEAAGPFRP